MWNKLKVFLNLQDRHIVVKWRFGDTYAIKDRKRNRFKSLTSPGHWWKEEDRYFISCCTSSDKEFVIEWCNYLNNKGTDWEEVE